MLGFDISAWQWILLTLFGLVFFILAPYSKKVSEFYGAKSKNGKAPNMLLLTSSLVISWIFAKSITNSANLGLSYGLVGGISYAAYYLSFVVAGLVIYKMRVKGKFSSIHHFIRSKYGRVAILIFSLLIAFRLFNEIWSNTMIIGSYFGEAGSPTYYLSILLFTGLTLAYTLKGGLRSSFLTDAIQMIFFGVLLIIILGVIIPKSGQNINKFIDSGTWSSNYGLNLFFVALIQIFSYPFHDSVMTDRGFVSDPKTTLKSFIWAAVIGFVCLTLFSFVGVYAQLEGVNSGAQAAVEVGKKLGPILMLIINFIMITSAASTLDSAFSSFSKLTVIDLQIGRLYAVKTGRLMMVLLVVLGTLPVFANPEILSATTISGTMVMGLAPVFLFWFLKAPPISFLLSVGLGILFGILFTLNLWPQELNFGTGPYADLLSVNLIGLIICFIGFFTPILLKK